MLSSLACRSSRSLLLKNNNNKPCSSSFGVVAIRRAVAPHATARLAASRELSSSTARSNSHGEKTKDCDCGMMFAICCAFGVLVVDIPCMIVASGNQEFGSGGDLEEVSKSADANGDVDKRKKG